MVLSCAAASAAFGIVQYGILHYDQLGQRPQGTLGPLHDVFRAADDGDRASRLRGCCSAKSERTWAALVMPALGVAVALTFTRNAAVGVCVAAALLFSLKDFRLFAVLPIVAAVFIAAAPGQIAKRYASMFNMNDPTVRDRVAMLRDGGRMIAAHPLTGVGPNMVERLYPQYRGPDAVEPVNPHLHNVPLQIAAERGLPALAIWLWFMVALVRDLWKRFSDGRHRELGAAALADDRRDAHRRDCSSTTSGTPKFLMLFLLIVTLPFAAADRSAAA